MKKSFLTLLSLSVIGSASTVAAQDFNIAAKHAIAVEATFGKIYMRCNATVEIASITKLLTVYLVYEDWKWKYQPLSTPVDISDYLINWRRILEASNVPMEARNYTGVEELLEANSGI